MSRWLPTDPRQREIHRLLMLVGGEPASYFADACQLMEGSVGLEATTHLVGHLLRELDGALAGVVRPMVPPEQWPHRGSHNAHRRKINAVCDALRVSDDDELRESWYGYASNLHGRAHRHGLARPRPVDADFRELWEQGQAVIFALTRRIEANFTATLPVIDALAAGAPRLRELREQVPHSTVALDRFFDQASPAWFTQLRDAGYFADPPRLEVDEDGMARYPRWPPGRYLARIAASNPVAVIELGVDLVTDNPEAQESFVEAACAAPPAVAARLVPTVERWLDTPAQWALPIKVRDLSVHLINGGQVDSGLSLLRALAANEHVGQDRYLTGELIGGLPPAIFPASGLDGLEVLVDLLHEQVTEEAYGEQDHSSIWRPHLEGGRRQDFRDALVSGVRDASAALVEGGTSVGDVFAVLTDRHFSIFRRLALDLLTRFPDADLIAACLTDEELFYDMSYTREYAALAHVHFRHLHPEAQATILGRVDSAPRWVDNEEQRRHWQRHMLERLGRPLPGEWEERLAALADVAGAPEPLLESGFVGPRSPLDEAELAAMSVDEIVAALRDWRSEANDWRAPTAEGLSRVLERVITVDPQRFAEGAAAFAELDATYVRALLGGLRRAVSEGRSFQWLAVLELIWKVRTMPRVIEGRDPSGFNIDPGWTWAWLQSLHLIEDGLRPGDGQFPREECGRVWRVIEHFLSDLDPSGEDGEREPATRALNSLRGMATRNAFRYAWWLRGDLDDPMHRLPDETRQALAQRLQPGIETSTAVRSVFGEFFPILVACDEVFAAEHVNDIFPPDDDRLWRAAWHMYLRANRAYLSTVRLLHEQYRRGVEDLGVADTVDDLLGNVGDALGAHVMTLYAVGEIALGDGGLLDRFYALASVERRAEALESIGRGLEGNDLPVETAARFRVLFEARLEYVRAGGNGEELRGFAWWFASGAFDDDWSLRGLRDLLEVGGRIHPDHVVASRLAAMRSEHLLEAVDLIERMIETGTREWFVVGARDDIATVLADGLAAGGEAEARARDVVGRLVARGHRDFERLLPG
jgi:hypothetical protein